MTGGGGGRRAPTVPAGRRPAGGDLADRFAAAWAELAPIGRDPATGGYRRFAWTAADAALRGWFAAQAAVRGLQVRTDRNGNLWAWWGAPGPGAVVTGSHLDSVPDGGAFDGPLGVVGGFLAIDELRARGAVPARPVGVVAWADEEGARFGTACVGSRLAVGSLDPATAGELTDADGVSLSAAVQAAGVDPAGLGADEPVIARIGALVELHVEQGRALAGRGAAVGVATEIWPHGRWRLRFDGEANHAGTTRLSDRHDPMLVCAAAVRAARDAARSAGGVATIGRVRVVPNGANAIPSAVDAWLDARAPGDAALAAIVAGVSAAAAAAAGAEGVRLTVDTASTTPAVRFDVGLRDRVAGVLAGLPDAPTPVPLLATAAGHDAGILAARVPTAMLFVRNPTGISHSPAEHAEPADCVAGVTALAAVLSELACR